jgi:predicted transcriptional regulator
MSNRRPSGALETEVLAALWAAATPLTPREVQRDLGEGLAYTTVMTALARLHEKGVVTREKQGRAYAYTPLLDTPGIAAARMRALLDKSGDREVVLARFLGTLSDSDERTLVQLLNEPRPEDRDRP